MKDDAYLSDGYCLLFHNLVDGSSIRFGHFVELVDATNALIGQYQSAAFQRHLAGQRVLQDGRSKTNTRRTATSRVLTCDAKQKRLTTSKIP